MKELLEKKLWWETELQKTDPSDPYTIKCRQELTHAEAMIEAEKSKSKKTTKKTKKSKK